MYGDDGPDDDYMTPEQAEERGWINEDVVEYPEGFPRAGNRSDAAMILIDNHINPAVASKPEDPAITWAKHLLKDVVG